MPAGLKLLIPGNADALGIDRPAVTTLKRAIAIELAGVFFGAFQNGLNIRLGPGRL
jgi:hypothetical protein